MKKYMFSLVLILFAVQVTYAQDLSHFISEISEIEGVQKQVVDRSMLDMSIKAAMDTDSTGQMKSNLPPFMDKVESIEIITAKNCKPEVKAMFLEEFKNFKDGNGYASLLSVNEENNKVRIISHKDENTGTSVFVFVLSNKDAVIVKISGDLNESDIMDIVNEQNKNK